MVSLVKVIFSKAYLNVATAKCLQECRPRTIACITSFLLLDSMLLNFELVDMILSCLNVIIVCIENHLYQDVSTTMLTEWQRLFVKIKFTSLYFSTQMPSLSWNVIVICHLFQVNNDGNSTSADQRVTCIEKSPNERKCDLRSSLALSWYFPLNYCQSTAISIATEHRKQKKML
jgi:hypothetical protein